MGEVLPGIQRPLVRSTRTACGVLKYQLVTFNDIADSSELEGCVQVEQISAALGDAGQSLHDETTPALKRIFFRPRFRGHK
jgi:hypothetical protein